jgi:hypothetical protein
VVNGTATFPKLFLDKPGQGYTLVATCTNGETAVSNPFNVDGGEVRMDDNGVYESDTKANTVEAHYHVVQGDVGQPFTIKLYRARAERLSDNRNAGDLIPLGSVEMTGAALKQGPHVADIRVKGNLPLGIDGFHPYVVAVADPDHRTTEVNPYYDQESFRIRTIGIVSEGFTLGVPWSSKSPTWVTDITTALHGKDGYDRVIPYAWHSSTVGYTADRAGHFLYDEVARVVRDLKSTHANSPHDLINFHFIGHSRGCVVISRAVEDLYTNAKALGVTHEYVKMTFMDPHPASPAYGVDASVCVPGDPINDAKVAAYVAFEAATWDGRVSAVGVNEVEEFYQKTNYSVLSSWIERYVINLQGLTPANVDGLTSPFLKSTVLDLTNKRVSATDARIIGHDEITDWYQVNVVNTGKVVTGSTIPTPLS